MLIPPVQKVSSASARGTERDVTFTLQGLVEGGLDDGIHRGLEVVLWTAHGTRDFAQHTVHTLKPSPSRPDTPGWFCRACPAPGRECSRLDSVGFDRSEPAVAQSQ